MVVLIFGMGIGGGVVVDGWFCFGVSGLVGEVGY